MGAITVRIDGVGKVQQRLREIARQVAQNVTVDAALEASEVMKDEIQVRTPVFLDRLRPGISVQLKEREDHKVIIWVGPTSRRFVARFLEYGTRKMSPRPFVRPAFEAAKGRVQQAFRAAVTRELDRIKGALS